MRFSSGQIVGALIVLVVVLIVAFVRALL